MAQGYKFATIVAVPVTSSGASVKPWPIIESASNSPHVADARCQDFKALIRPDFSQPYRNAGCIPYGLTSHLKRLVECEGIEPRFDYRARFPGASSHATSPHKPFQMRPASRAISVNLFPGTG